MVKACGACGSCAIHVERKLGSQSLGTLRFLRAFGSPGFRRSGADDKGVLYVNLPQACVLQMDIDKSGWVYCMYSVVSFTEKFYLLSR